MANYRAAKSGLARDSQIKIDNAFNVDEARKCLQWIAIMIDEDLPIEDTEDKITMRDCFYKILKDGIVLCRLINVLLPDDRRIDFSKKSFQPTNMPAFVAARERERIGIFLSKVDEYGVPNSASFQTDYLYERTNLVQVCTCIRSLGIEAQSRPDYNGPYVWPKKSEENRRTFTEEQLQAGQQVISLQYGTNKGASQTGMSFGKSRKIID
ncbi:hypothetical protein ACJMK2_029195 [Sinanodonta woodiana]|uniref:Transgelin n=1 Tax=Sinanodonta woodiana TaxID=1069815 RepID=A0ABD3XD26_SINWO